MSCGDLGDDVVNDEVTRKLTTILAADVAGYTRFMRAVGETTFKILGEYREMIDGLIAGYVEFGRAVETRRGRRKSATRPLFFDERTCRIAQRICLQGKSRQDRYIEALRQAGLPE